MLTSEFNVEEVEAKAAFRGLEIAWDVGVRRVVLEVDCLSVVSALNRGLYDRSPFGFMIRDIAAFAKKFTEFACHHVKRECNYVAHSSARSSALYNELRVWMEDAPRDVMTLVLADWPH